jgi:hypothetical protein
MQEAEAQEKKVAKLVVVLILLHKIDGSTSSASGSVGWLAASIINLAFTSGALFLHKTNYQKSAILGYIHNRARK